MMYKEVTKPPSAARILLKRRIMKKPHAYSYPSVLNHPKQAMVGTHYLICKRVRQLSVLCFPTLFKPTAPLSPCAEMGFCVGVMDRQIGLNVSTRPSKEKYLHSHSQR